MQRHDRVPSQALWQIPPCATRHDEPRVLIADDDLEATRAICLALEDAEFTVRAVLNRGKAEATVWTCDFSFDYVKINAEYRT